MAIDEVYRMLFWDAVAGIGADSCFGNLEPLQMANWLFCSSQLGNDGDPSLPLFSPSHDIGDPAAEGQDLRPTRGGLIIIMLLVD